MALKYSNKNLPINAIRDSDFSWKREITDADLEELSDNIALVGQLHPIIVRPKGKGGTTYELIAGQRRLLAAKRMKESTIRCSVVRCDDKMATIISLSENLKTKRPNNTEWESGLHKLSKILKVDRDREAHSEAERREVEEKAKRLRGGKGVSGTRCQKPTGGRPKSTQREAVQEAAKLVGVSERAAQGAVRRVENLTPSAARALETGKISIEQANRLASMSISDQRRQLMDMVKESREQTSTRLRKEKDDHAKDRTSVFVRKFSQIGQSAVDLSGQMDDALNYVDGKEVDWDRAMKTLPKDIEKINSAMKALAEMVEWLLTSTAE